MIETNAAAGGGEPWSSGRRRAFLRALPSFSTVNRSDCNLRLVSSLIVLHKKEIPPMNITRILALILALAAPLTLAACDDGGEADNEQVETGETADE